MNWWRPIRYKLRALFRRRQLEAEMAEEMDLHVENQTRNNLAAGMPPEEARRAARRQFGWTESLKERCREQRGVSWLEDLVQDVRFGARQLRKNPGFTAVAVLTLALGIGANTAIFSVVDAVLLKPLPYSQPDRLVRLWSDLSGTRHDQRQFAPAEIGDVTHQLTSFEGIGMFDVGLSVNLTGGIQPERLDVAEASPGLFTTLRVQPLHGRTFLPDETDVAQSKVALISEGLWKRRFGSDPAIAGRTVQLDGQSFSIVGVLPGNFRFPEGIDLWLPFSFTASDWKQDRDHCYVDAVGRLRGGISAGQAQVELETIAKRLTADAPEERKRWGVSMVPLHEQVVGNVRPTLWILFGVVAVVLLIACVNLASLLLTRGAARQKEITIRTALGAGRRRIFQQLLTEAMLLSVLGGGLGAVLAAWSVRVFSVSNLNTLPYVGTMTVSGSVFLFTLLVSVLTGVLCGVAPAWNAANPNLDQALREGGRASSAGTGTQRKSLVVAEVALSLILLVGAGLLIGSFLRLGRVSTGFDPHHLLTLQVTLPKTQYPDTARQDAFLREALGKIRALPGVKSAAATINLPLARAWGMGYWVPNRENTPNQIADNAYVTPNYFGAMGIRMVRGRDFSDQDSDGKPLVAVISEELARRHFPNQDPIGQILSAGGDREIVGVVADVKPRGLELASQPAIYIPYAQKITIASFATFTVRTEAEPLGLARSCERAITGLDGNLPVAGVSSMEQIVSGSLKQRRLTMILLSSFAVIAVVLALIGIYGLLACAVAQRSREIGIRMALGARRAQILGLILGQGMKLVLIGIATGLIAALALSGFMRALLFGVGPTDPATFGGVALLLVAVALLACYLPARRAAKIEPMLALRQE